MKGDRTFAVVASNGGRDRDPSWRSNLRSNPKAEIQIRKEKVKVRGREASDEEKSRLWPVLTAMYPTYNVYQSKTKRQIPVVMLEPSPK